jgi:hypothetical protein
MAAVWLLVSGFVGFGIALAGTSWAWLNIASDRVDKGSEYMPIELWFGWLGVGIGALLVVATPLVGLLVQAVVERRRDHQDAALESSHV